MSDKGMTLAIVLLVAGLIVGGGIGYFAAPTKETVIVESGRENYPVKPMYTTSLPRDMSDVSQYRDGNYILYVWESGGTVYWTYAKVGG